MKIRFIGQGFDCDLNSPVGSELLRNFNDPNYRNFFGIVAFVSKSGISGLSDAIISAKGRFGSIKIIVGVDQLATSREALEELNTLDIDSYVYYSTQRLIFHPKIYIFSGNHNCIIVGSSNLTTPGLFQNIESSLVVEFEENDTQGQRLLTEIQTYFSSFISNNDLNVKKLNNELIGILSNGGIIPTEVDRIIKQNKRKSRIHSEKEDEDFNIIKSLFPSIKVQSTDADFKKGRRAPIISEEDEEGVVTEEAEIEINRGELVWSKPNLPPSDAQIAVAGTNPTGCLRLTQAEFEVNDKVIDQTTYFRNTLFANYDWAEIRNDPFVESAKIPFNIKINKKDYGSFNLEIKHKPSGEADQSNYTTSLHWGNLTNIIRDINITGKTLNLFRSQIGEEELFEIEIV